MKHVRTLLKFSVAVIAISLLLHACAHSQLSNNRSYEAYQDHIASTPESQTVDALQIFSLVFKDFKHGATADNIRAIYAEEFYFNDTIKSFTRLEDLIDYLTHTAAKVDATTVEINDVVKSNEDYYIRWTMNMQLTVMGRTINSNSIGMTQLRFNEQGKIIFHQDYWDGAEGIYEHLPYVGRWVKKIKERM